MVVVHVAQQYRRTIHYIDHHIDLAVVEQIAKCAAAARNDICQPCAFYRRYELKLLPGQIVKEQRALREARAPIEFVHLGINMAVDEKQVLPSVVVVVEKSVTPA